MRQRRFRVRLVVIVEIELVDLFVALLTLDRDARFGTRLAGALLVHAPEIFEQPIVTQYRFALLVFVRHRIRKLRVHQRATRRDSPPAHTAHLESP